MDKKDLIKTSKVLLLEGGLSNKIVGVFPVNEMLVLFATIADDELRRELADVLPSTLKPYNFKNEGLTPLFGRADAVHSASVVFLSKKVSLKPNFCVLANKQFGMGTFNLHSMGLTSEQKLATLNDFVAVNTNREIQKFFDSAKEIEDTPLGLLNALHFALKWETPFKEVNTHQRVFFGLLNKDRKIDFLSGEQKISVETTECFEAVELPFMQEKKVKLILVKPLTDFTKFLQEFDFTALFSRLSNGVLPKELVNLALPKFKIRTRADLSQSIKQLGAGGAFERGNALPGLAEEKLVVNKFLQEAVIEVNETGIKVACVTAVMMMKMCRPVSPKKKIVFDKPFLFFVVSEEKVLFAGTFTDV